MRQSLRSPALRRKRRRKTIIRICLVALLLFGLIAVPAVIVNLDFWKIQTIEVSGNTTVPTEDIVEKTKEKISGKYAHLFSKDNIIIYPNNKIESELLETFKQIETISIGAKNLTTLKISITERKPFGVWCRDVNVITNNSCFFLDKNGFIFNESPTLSSPIYFVFKGNIEGEPIGQYFLPEDLFKKIALFVEKIRDVSLEPVSLSVLGQDEYSVSIKGGSEILFLLRLDDDGDEIISNLKSVLLDEELNLIEDGILQASSIDLRYGNKVILKKSGD